MKQGDQVSTPDGPGIFFEFKETDKEVARVRLVTPKEEGLVWCPIITSGPIWECLPCNLFKVTDLEVTKTFEQRQQEANEEMAKAQQAPRDAQQAAYEEKVRRFNEARKGQQQNESVAKPGQ